MTETGAASLYVEFSGLLLGEISSGAEGPKEPTFTVGLGWDSPRDPWFGERLAPQPPTSGGKVGEGIRLLA